MKTVLATAVATLALLGSAFAATVEGVVQSVDPATGTVVLQDGTAFMTGDTVAPDVLAALQAGAKVRVTVEDGTTNVTGIEIVQ